MYYQRFLKINVLIIGALLIFSAGTLSGNDTVKYRSAQQDGAEEILIFKDGRWQPPDSSDLRGISIDSPLPSEMNGGASFDIIINEMSRDEISITQTLELSHPLHLSHDIAVDVIHAEMEIPSRATIKEMAEYRFLPHWQDCHRISVWGKLKNLSKELTVKGNIISWKGLLSKPTMIEIKYSLPITPRTYETIIGKATFRVEKNREQLGSQWSVKGERFWIKVYDDSVKVTRIKPDGAERTVSKVYSYRIKQLIEEFLKASILSISYSPSQVDSQTGHKLIKIYRPSTDVPTSSELLMSLRCNPGFSIINIEKSVAPDDSQAKYEGYYVTEPAIWIKVLSDTPNAEIKLRTELANYKLFLSMEDSLKYVEYAFELAQIWDKTLQKKSLPFFLPDNPKRFW